MIQLITRKQPSMTAWAVMAAIDRRWEVSMASLFATIGARTPPHPGASARRPAELGEDLRVLAQLDSE